jgi:YD repeat-containing protein
MRTFLIALACCSLSVVFLYAQKKRFYPTPFITVSWDNMIKGETYSFNNEVGGPSDYFYDRSGILYQKVFTRSDGFTTTTSFDYHPDGRLKTSLRILQDGREMVFTYGYDDAHHLVTRVAAIGDSITSRELYNYDSTGMLVNAFYTNVDGWLSGRLDFTHTRENRLATGTFTGDDNRQADIWFTYNSEGLLAEIRWVFSNGKFQVYNFEYFHFTIITDPDKFPDVREPIYNPF